MYVQPYTTTCDRINLTSSAGSSFLPWDEAAYSYALVKPRLSSKNLGMRPMKAWEWDQWKPGNEADVNLWSMNLTEVIKSLSSPGGTGSRLTKNKQTKNNFMFLASEILLGLISDMNWMHYCTSNPLSCSSFLSSLSSLLSSLSSSFLHTGGACPSCATWLPRATCIWRFWAQWHRWERRTHIQVRDDEMKHSANTNMSSNEIFTPNTTTLGF